MSLFPRRVESERLRFEPLHESADVLDLYEFHRSGDLTPVMQHLSQTVYDTPKQSMDKLASAEEHWKNSTRAEFAIVPTESESGAGEFAGVATLMAEWEKNVCYFGLWLREPFWGRGYSGERAGAMLAVAFDALDFDLVSAGYVPGNTQSKRAIEKYVDRYGGQYDGVLRNWIPGDDGPRDLETYSILQAQWRDAVTDDELATLDVQR